MTTRTRTHEVTFEKPFILNGFDEELPPGTYTVETDEERLEGLSFPAYRRILTMIHLHAGTSGPGVTRVVTLDPDDLEAALKRDEGQSRAEAAAAQASDQERSIPVTTAWPDDADADEMDRAENEGMIVRLGPGECGLARAGDRAGAVQASSGDAGPPQDRSGLQ